MKDYLKQLLAERGPRLAERDLVREYLQARILQSLQENGAFVHWAFHGGTALRFLYSIPRYSEDLDFALVDPGRDCRLREIVDGVKKMFESEDYTVGLKVNDQKTVATGLVRFPGLLYELGISPHRDETTSVKLEVDTVPPTGAATEISIVRRYVTLNLLHHDRASLLAGKLHALLTRRYTKGRDLYDLMWYLADPAWPAPNLVLLNSALCQTGWSGGKITEQNWRKLMAEQLDGLQWNRVVDDVRPFLERQADVNWLTKENCRRLLLGRSA